MILVVFRGTARPAAALRGFAFIVALTGEVRVFSFVFAVFDFAVFAFGETLREPLVAALFEFLRGAILLRELFFLVLFLVAMIQVYHPGSGAIHLMAVGRHCSQNSSKHPALWPYR